MVSQFLSVVYSIYRFLYKNEKKLTFVIDTVLMKKTVHRMFRVKCTFLSCFAILGWHGTMAVGIEWIIVSYQYDRKGNETDGQLHIVSIVTYVRMVEQQSE